ncbi:UDP-N-acetylmuramoyl-tripeptide--D-alanyl-D-alanine ligase [Aidingimonas halophila]|uniref:UDP-N-acetylmuramoyl-tripeptide--D-alanyl-D-alanine ligase n=1 Tax=Aidingimonas halophila TaxID=574349 RepID=A0A1H2QSH9_9GAMM|nr:UDP-N-acetylmuramoyl-tripeptide--D-alanyl-D-alanine ligase [Aidingimonas halophila]GHC20288.1 UDP-N-acetylmuramoyl-tripeptide--D-alanyl-D-alanine ligase [Aidingimonas halophila]SDW10146.1 UDP-N-acetylmuramoyl-tripeptide--D-alanyl-D-alanine ligase [Aidingimonas halophila]
MTQCGLATLADIADILAIDCPEAEEKVCHRIVTDTRTLAPGDLFLALVGERFDGHDFIANAREAGAIAAIVSRPIDDDLPQLVVEDTRLALGVLGQARRRAWDGPLVAITGNSGKTTVKELVASLLGGDHEVLASQGNFNNDIGAPLTLLSLRPEHQYAVIELGANHLGEIAWTSALSAPNVAVITNVTGAHLGEFGGRGRIAQAKGEILSGLPDDGVAVLNRDDAFFSVWQRLAMPHDVLDFGMHPAARLRASGLVCDALGRYAFTLLLDGRALGRVTLSLLGRYNVSNALAAAACALAMGVSETRVVNGLSSFRPMPGRMAVVDGVRGTHILDDTYNASPGAVKAALELLAEWPSPRWCVLGAMAELGDASPELHADIGHYARACGVQCLVAMGTDAKPAVDAFGDMGCHFEQWEALVGYAREHLPTGASVLVKGSRSAAMERVVDALRCDGSR